MGRPKQYDPEEKIELARRLFNERGYSATSVTDLVDALGMNKKSIYAEFGSKQQLFEAALRLHLVVNIGYAIGAMESSDAGLAEVRSAIELWGRGARGPSAGTGCLLCNTAAERAAQDVAVAEIVREYVERIEGAFANALGRAQERGELVDDINLEPEARFFASHALGQLTLIRSGVAPEIVESAAEVAVAHLASLTA